MGQSDNRLNNNRIIGINAEILDKAAINLQTVEGEMLQITQR